MANQAEKKRLQRAAAYRKYLSLGGVVVTVVYLLCRMGLFGESAADVGYELGLHSVITVFLAYSVVSSERGGYDTEYYFDALALNWVVQLLSLYWPGAWNLFWLIPGFAVFKLGKLVWGYVFKSQGGESPLPDPAELARQEKKQRKMERKQVRAGVPVQ